MIQKRMLAPTTILTMMVVAGTAVAQTDRGAVKQEKDPIKQQSATSQPSVSPATAESERSARPPLEEALYSGWRSSHLLGSRVFSRRGEYLGAVRNIVLADDGQIKALIAEEAGIGLTPGFVFRLPWENVVKPVHRGTAD